VLVMLVVTCVLTSQLPLILVCTPHALKMPSQAQVVTPTAMKPSGSAALNSGHDGPAAVKAAPAARRFAVWEP